MNITKYILKDNNNIFREKKRVHLLEINIFITKQN